MHRIRYLIGTLTLIAAIAGAIWIVRILRNLDDRPGLAVQIEFRDARGLRAGAGVRYRGVTVGTVRAVSIGADGERAVASVLLDPPGAAQACVNSAFWIVTPRFSGLASGSGVTGLDTLVRDAYVAFQTPVERGSPMVAGSLIAGRERPPAAIEPEALEDVEHGDLLMSLLVPENHGLRVGSAVIFRGMQTGDVRSVELAADGTHVEVKLRVARRHRQTVTDKTEFWVARPALTGALFSGFTVTDMNALLSPFVGYYGEPGKGVMVESGFRAAAAAERPKFEMADVPAEALRRATAGGEPIPEDLVLVRIVYEAIERDTWSPDDPIHREGSGVLFRDREGRWVVVTARSLVDGSYTERDAWGGDADVSDEQIKVRLPSGAVLRAGRVWVHQEGADLAALLLADAPADLRGTPLARLQFAGTVEPGTGPHALRGVGPDGAVAPQTNVGDDKAAALADHLGAAVTAGDRVVGIWGRAQPLEDLPKTIALELLPADLRPQ